MILRTLPECYGIPGGVVNNKDPLNKGMNGLVRVRPLSGHELRWGVKLANISIPSGGIHLPAHGIRARVINHQNHVQKWHTHRGAVVLRYVLRYGTVKSYRKSEMRVSQPAGKRRSVGRSIGRSKTTNQHDTLLSPTTPRSPGLD